jgi:hypothetical protein
LDMDLPVWSIWNARRRGEMFVYSVIIPHHAKFCSKLMDITDVSKCCVLKRAP